MDYEIIPAVMPKNIEDIESHAMLVRHNVQTIQLDLMDGKYVPERTWPFTRTGALHASVVNDELELPFWEELNYELDLMVERPEEHLETWFSIGSSRVIFHYASVHDWDKILHLDTGIRNFVEIGLAVTIHDNLDKVYELIDTGAFDMVQVMGIGQVGYQGMVFEEKALDIIAEISHRYPNIIISVDGGVSRNTIARIADAGALRFVSGSAIYSSDIPSENVEQLYGELYK